MAVLQAGSGWQSHDVVDQGVNLLTQAAPALYSDVPSRPNVPVNVLVSLDTLKAGFGCSDEELCDHFLYDLQVRHAVGYDSLGEGEFELRTLYSHRRRLSQYNLEHDANLLEAALADITDQQITTVQVAPSTAEDVDKLHLPDFSIAQYAGGVPLTITCPHGQLVPGTPASKPGRFAAESARATCETCPLYTAGRCPPQLDNRRRSLRLTFTQVEVERSQRHRRSRARQSADRNPRADVESTVRSVWHFFQGSHFLEFLGPGFMGCQKRQGRGITRATDAADIHRVWPL